MALAQNPALARRSHAAAARALPARRGDPLLRHPHRARRDGPRPVVRRGRGPAFARPLRDEAAIAALAVPDMATLRYVFDAVARIKRALRGRVPLIGFAGSPFTLACYMIEGGGSDDFRDACAGWRTRGPTCCAHRRRQRAAPSSRYLSAQIAAGADAVMMFDTWGGLLTRGRLSRAFRSRRCAAIARRAVPRRAIPTHRVHQGRRRMARATSRRAARRASASTGRVDIALRARTRRRPRRAAGQPRSDGAVRPIRRRSRARRSAIVRAAGPAPGHIFNLGHGIVPRTPPEQRRGAGRSCACSVARSRAGLMTPARSTGILKPRRCWHCGA